MSRWIALLAATLVAALGVAACGEDDEGTTTTVASESSDSRELVVEADEGAFNARAVYESAGPSVVTSGLVCAFATLATAGIPPSAMKAVARTRNNFGMISP